MDEQPNDAGGGRPKFLNSMTAWVGGATALIVALGGLATATQGLWNKPAAQAPTPDTTEPSSAADPSSAEDQPVKPATHASYTFDDGGTLQWEQGMWVLTDKDDNVYRYTQEDDDGTMAVAVMRKGGEKGEDVWLRWPKAGGMASESQDDQYSWNDLGRVTVDQPPG